MAGTFSFLTSQPNFLASIGYKISLAMVLRWRATREGSAINNSSEPGRGDIHSLKH